MGTRSASGQASVELVALLPLIAVLAAGLWQVALCGQAVWAASAAARAAARADAVGGDASAAGLRLLPSRLRAGASVRGSGDGGARVRVPVRALVGGRVLWTIDERATFARQR